METGGAASAKLSPSSSSRYVKTVVLRDWWLVRSQTECEGKNLAVSGLPDEERAVRMFTSAPVVKRHSVLTLETADGVYIILKGFINRPLTEEGGFSLDVFKHFLFGFPLNWEEYAGRKFGDDECPFPVSSPSKTTVSGSAVIIEETKTPVNVPAGEVTDCVNSDPTTIKSKSVSNSTKSNVGAASGVKDTKPKPTIPENDPAGGTPTARKSRIVSNSIKSNVGAASGVKDTKTKPAMHENGPAGRENDGVKSNLTAKKSRVVSNCTNSNLGATSSSKGINTKLKTSETVPPVVAVDVVKAPQAKKYKSIIGSAISDMGASSAVKDKKRKLTTSENAPAGGASDVVKVSPTTKKSKCATKSNVGVASNSDVKDLKKKLKTSQSVPAGEANDVVKATPAKKSILFGNSAQSSAGATSGVNDMETKSTLYSGASLSERESLKISSDIPSDISSLKKSRSGRLLLHPLEFWRNQKAVYDSSRQITGIVDGTPESGKDRGSKRNREKT